MSKNNYNNVMDYLKQRLKQSKISYESLAGIIGIPESTLKKWFSAEDGSFNRITLICEALGITLTSVLKGIEEKELSTFTFSKKQQDHFRKDKIAFKIYWLLVYERKKDSDVMTILKLSQAEFKKSLFVLDRLNLIELKTTGAIKIPKMTPIYWKFAGKFMEDLFIQWSGSLLEDAKKTETEGPVLQFYQLIERSRQNLKSELQQLEEKYARITILELAQIPEKLCQVRYLRSTANGSYVTG